MKRILMKTIPMKRSILHRGLPAFLMLAGLFSLAALPAHADDWSKTYTISGKPDLRYVLRWETLDANRDQPRQGLLPPPSMLRLYAIKSVTETKP